MSETKRTYGFRIRRETWADQPSVVADIMAREGDKSHPINCHSVGERAYEGASKAQAGLQLDFSIRVYVDSRGEVTGPMIRYETAHYIEAEDADRMGKTLRKISKAIERDRAREPGDVLMSVAKAIGATWLVTKMDPDMRERFYSDCDWRFDDGATCARDAFRAAIAEILKVEKGVAA